MKAGYVIILFALLAAIVGFALIELGGHDNAAVAADAAQSSEPVILATATLVQIMQAAPTATVYQTPTPNQQATLVAMELEAANKNLEASGRNATAVVQAAQLNAQAIQYQADADVRISENDVILQTLINKGKEYDAMMMNYAMRRDEIHSSLELSEKRSFGDVIWAVALICLSIAMIISAWMRKPAQIVVARAAEQSKAVAGLMEKETDGNGWDRIAPIPDGISVEMVYFWLRIALDNKDSLAVDAWESRKDSPFKSPLYRRWHRWLTDPRHRFLAGDPARRNITILSERGRRYFVQRWMPANPLPYRSNDPESATIATVTTGIVATGAEGEGVLG